MDRKISPPPLKRRRVETRKAEDAASGPEQDDMRLESSRFVRIYTWNINGIQPFLPATQIPISSFFKPAGSRSTGADESSAVVDGSGPTSTGNPLRAFLKRHRWPEVLLLQELKISPSDMKTPAAVLSAVNASLGTEDSVTERTRYELDVNLPRDKHNARGFGGKLYGVGTFLREDFAERHVAAIRHAEWDLEGRVTIVELRRPQEEPSGIAAGAVESQQEPPMEKKPMSQDPFKPLALLNIYAVNGTSAPYRSPDTGKVIGTRHDHKLRFHERLRDECFDLEKRGFEVVVAGDLNIARGKLDGWPGLRTYPRQHCVNRAHFNAKFFGQEDNARDEAYLGEEPGDASQDTNSGGGGSCFDGVDVFRALRGKERRYTYHSRSGLEWGASCDRVDLIFTSKSLVDQGKVMKTDILDSPQERGTSDHVPLWVELKLADVTGQQRK